MGFENRDYAKDDYGDYSSSSNFGNTAGWSICRWLITITAGVFLLQVLIVNPQGHSPITNWLRLSPIDFQHGQIWRILTYAFCHSRGDILHLLFNMLFLFWFGKILEDEYGRKEFLSFYLVAAVFSGMMFLFIGFLTKDRVATIGASGSIMAVVMLFAMKYPKQKVNIYFVLPVEIRWLVLFYVIFDSLPILRALTGGDVHDGVAHSAHIGGLLFGFLYYKFQWRIENFVPGNISMPKMKNKHQRSFKVYEPEKRADDDKLDETVDEILAKISKHGEESLTGKERKILKKASEKYKNR